MRADGARMANRCCMPQPGKLHQLRIAGFGPCLRPAVHPKCCPLLLDLMVLLQVMSKGWWLTVLRDGTWNGRVTGAVKIHRCRYWISKHLPKNQFRATVRLIYNLCGSA